MKHRKLLFGLTAGLVGVALGMTVAFAVQDHMDAAAHHLEEARAELNQADADKGGHRDKAIELVDKAMEQVKAGIEFAHNHPAAH